MKTPASPIPSFIQLGAEAMSILNTDEISYITRELMEVTDEKRDRYKGLITPEGEAYVIRVWLKSGQSITYKCVTEEFQTEIFTKLSRALQTSVLELPVGLQGVFRTLGRMTAPETE